MRVLLVIGVFMMSSCAEYRALIAHNGAESADATLESAEWAICKAATAGSLERRYSLYSNLDSKKAQGWLAMCHGQK